MALLDFFRDRQAPAQGGTFTADFGLADDNPITRQYGAPELQRAPVMQEQPGLLSRAWDYIKSPEGRQTIGTAMRSAGGEEGAFDDLRHLRQQEAAQAREAKATADRAKKNAAFRAAYVGGKFDPAAYLGALEGTDVDATDALDFQSKLAPKAGVDGGYGYRIDPISGETEWGEQRPMSYAEELAEERAAELEAYREEQLRLAGRRADQGDARIGITRAREGRIARSAGGGAGGAEGPKPWERFR